MSSTASPLSERRARVRQIRARVAVGAVALFVAVFGFLFGQLSSGSDPGLTDNAATTTTSQAAGQSDDQGDTGGQSIDQTWSTDGPGAVSTGQS